MGRRIRNGAQWLRRFAAQRLYVALSAADANQRLTEFAATLPDDRRPAWYRGKTELLTGDLATAVAEFDSVPRLRSDSKRRGAQVRTRVFSAAPNGLCAGNCSSSHDPLLGAGIDQGGVRTGLERCYRDLAHETEDMWERFELVRQANAIRPRTTL